MFLRGVAVAGTLRPPRRDEERIQILPVEWRTIQRDGVRVLGLKYDSEELTDHDLRGRRSPHRGNHAGLWPIHGDEGDATICWLQAPSGQWIALRERHLRDSVGPFSEVALEAAKKRATRDQTSLDYSLSQLLEQWEQGLIPTHELNAARLDLYRRRELHESVLTGVTGAAANGPLRFVELSAAPEMTREVGQLAESSTESNFYNIASPRAAR